MKKLLQIAALGVGPALWPLVGSTDPPPPAPTVDHHVHVRSPAATDVLLRLQEAVGQQIIDESDGAATTADDVVRMLDTAGLERAVLLSVAYFFGAPDLEVADEYARVRTENDYVGREAARYPDRLTAFCGVDPLADYALREIDRCAREPALSGLKLHLANSGVDLRDSTDVRRLAGVFRRANERRLPIVIHLYTRNPDYGRDDAEIFIRDVLSAAPDIPVQIAHLAGGGGFSDATDGASSAFVEAIEADSPVVDDVVFDVAAMVVSPARAEGDSALAQRIRRMNRRTARRIRAIGVERVVFGSDWEAVPADAALRAMRTALPLDDRLIDDLLDNVAPYMRRSFSGVGRAPGSGRPSVDASAGARTNST